MSLGIGVWPLHGDKITVLRRLPGQLADGPGLLSAQRATVVGVGQANSTLHAVRFSCSFDLVAEGTAWIRGHDQVAADALVAAAALS